LKKTNEYILFLDESGKSSFSDDGGAFLLSAIIINKDLHSALSSYMLSLKDKSGIPIDENIHAFDLFEKEDLKRHKVQYLKINTFFNRLASLVEGAEIKSFIFSVDKTAYKTKISKTATKKGVSEKALIKFLKRNNVHDFLYEALTRKAILEFGHYLEKEDAYGEVIAESRREDDGAVLNAFICATRDSTFQEGSRYKPWAKSSFKRIHSLTFQNKKGLSFGLEIADLFGWAYFNNKYGKSYPIASKAKNKRTDERIKKTNEILIKILGAKIENLTKTKINNVAMDRVSEFTKMLSSYKAV
jgi:hypothetical protein